MSNCSISIIIKKKLFVTIPLLIHQEIYIIQGHLTINRASFPSFFIICSTNTFESKFAFIE